VRVVLLLLPPPDVVDHISLGLLTVGEAGILLGEDSGGGLVVEALLLLEEAVGVTVVQEEGALVLVLLLVDDHAHGGETALAVSSVGDRQGLTDTLRLEGGTVRESAREAG
jgi:hypothetical protein